MGVWINNAYTVSPTVITWLSVVEDMGVVTVRPVTRGKKSGVHGTVTSGPVSGAKPNREKEGSHHLHHTADPV